MILDINNWDARTKKMLKIYPLDDERASYWLSTYNGDLRQVQLEYLRHFAGEAWSQAFYYKRYKSKDDLKLAINLFERAKLMYETWDDLTGTEPWGLPLERRKECKKLIDECKEKLTHM